MAFSRDRYIDDRPLLKKLFSGKFAGFSLLALGLLGAFFISYVIYYYGFVAGLLVVVGIVGLPIVIGTVGYPKFGITVLFIWAYWVNFLGNFTPAGTPVGTSMDILQYLLLLGFLISQKIKPNWKVFANPISYLMLAWISYNILQVLNPVAASKLAWVYTVRTVAIIVLMYFVFEYQINDFQFVKRLVKIWLTLTAVAAVYGYAQEINGYFPYEWAVLRRNPLTMHLNFQAGHWRKFSIFSDPVVFAYNMAITSALCLAMLFGKRSIRKKFVLAGLIVVYMYSMLFSGTRAGYVLLPACLVMLVVLYFNTRVLVIGSFVGMIFIFMIFVPTSNGTIKRFQSAFRPTEDASFNERAKNQAFIKPYIQSHPFGAGLGAVGIWGQRFAPNSPLSKFPPDSSYVRIAVELGSVGLLLFCTLIFVALKTGINNFFLIKDPELKNYTLGMVMVIFAFAIASYPQQSIVQFPSNIIFYLSIALINVLKRLDDEKQIAEKSVKRIES